MNTNLKGSDTQVGRLRKAEMYMHPAFIFFYLLLLFFFFVRVSLECKDVED